MSNPTCRELLDTLAKMLGCEEDRAIVSRVERVLALHQPSKFFKTPTCIECSLAGGDAPIQVYWPCRTVRTLDGEDL